MEVIFKLFNKGQVASFARSLFKIVGGAVGFEGMVSASEYQALAGAFAVIVGVVWSALTHTEPTEPAAE